MSIPKSRSVDITPPPPACESCMWFRKFRNLADAKRREPIDTHGRCYFHPAPFMFVRKDDFCSRHSSTPPPCKNPVQPIIL